MSPEGREKVFKQLRVDEGVVYETYICPAGHPTFGVGHLVLETDPEYGQPNGTPVSEERVAEAFEHDLDTAISECRVLYEDSWDGFPEEVQEILVNLLFNLGRPRLTQFKKMNAALEEGDWATAAVEGRDSRWYNQVGARAERLMSRLEVVS